MKIVLFEDDAVLNFFPLAVLKPITELVLGISTLREKAEKHFASPALLIRKQLRPYWREVLGDRILTSPLDTDELIFVNARCIVDHKFAFGLFALFDSGEMAMNTALFNGAQPVCFRVNPKTFFGNEFPDTVSASSLSFGMKIRQTDAQLISFPWELIRLHPQTFIREAAIYPAMGNVLGRVHPSAVLVNPSCIFIGEGADIKAGVVLDAEDGFIIVEKDAVVMPNSVLMNNVFIGKKSTVKIAAKIYDHVYIGERCKAGGEIEDSIMESYSNKQHEGFLGHSYISHWCNLGADTNTSDLKNNYSTVRMTFGKKEIDTKMQFLGLLMGEHSKSSINTMFNTGTIVGISSNIFGNGFPPKKVGSFQWGGAEGFTLYQIEKALETARAVMKRRGIEMTESYEKLIRVTYATLSE
ncbi:MAG: GlmU family protein [Chloroherpetonaceae bacterium]|nr:GlmU family protein [Chloroherpetonaceae bacterium]